MAAALPSPAKRPLKPEIVGLYAFLILAAAFFILPIGLVFLNSLKSTDELRGGSLLSLPLAPSFDAWSAAWATACTGLECNGISPGLINSFKITIPAVIISTLVGAINGFALSQFTSRLGGIMMFFVMFALFIPYQAMLYPTVRLLSYISLYNSLPGIILVHVIFGIPFTTLLFRSFFTGIPKELIKAARMEGAGFLRTFWSIVLPMSRNMFVVVAILQFTGIWNDYLLGLIFAGSDNIPMTVLLNNIVASSRGEALLNVNMAATLLTALPAIAVYFASGRYFVRGIAAGALKG